MRLKKTKKTITKNKFTQREKKIIVAESLLPMNSVSLIAKKRNINKDILTAWSVRYAQDPMVVKMVRNFLESQGKRNVIENLPMEPQKTENVSPKSKKGSRRFLKVQQKDEIIQESFRTSVPQAAKKYGIHPTMIYRWKKRLPKTGSGGTVIGNMRPDKNLKIENVTFGDIEKEGIPIQDWIKDITKEKNLKRAVKQFVNTPLLKGFPGNIPNGDPNAPLETDALTEVDQILTALNKNILNLNHEINDLRNDIKTQRGDIRLVYWICGIMFFVELLKIIIHIPPLF